MNQWGNVVYDKHVRPQEFVQDFRTEVSGVRPRDLRKGIPYFSLKHSISLSHICQLGEVEMFMWKRIWLDFAAEDMYTVQKELSDLLKGRILVGHALHNDLKVIYSLQEALS